MKLFNLDSPLMQALTKVADLLWLNILTIICSVPIVTIGASLTAMNYMALKIVRDEECYITKGFFKSFKENFRQATIIWLILLVVGVLLIADYFIMGNSDFKYSGAAQIAIMACGIILLCEIMFVFPVLAKFGNTIVNTMKNALMMSVLQFPKTVLMIIMYAIPAILFFFVVSLMPITFCFGLSVPAWCSAKLYNKFFKKLEDQITGANAEDTDAEPEEDERIFKDELDPALVERDFSNREK